MAKSSIRSFRARLPFIVVAMVLVLSACAPAAPAPAPKAAAPAAQAPAAQPAKPKTLQPFKWLFGFRIQANPSTGAIVLAKELGYYEEQGLDLTWDISMDATSIRLIAANQYQAGSVSSGGTVIDMIHEGLPMKVISVINHDNSRTFAVRKDSGIKRPKDFEGKTVAYKVSFWPEYLAMLAHDNVDRSKIREVEVGFSSVELQNNTVDVLPVFKSNEPYTLRNVLNVDIDFVDPADWGFPTFGTAIVVNADYARTNPDQVTAFLKATLKGLEYYIENKEKSLEIIQRHSAEQVTPVLNNFIYDTEVGQVTKGLAGEHGIGWVNEAMWEREIRQLAGLGVTKGSPAPSQIVDTSFIQRVIRDKKVVWP